MAESRDPISCEELVELATEYLEGTLAPEAVELLERHLDECEGCESHIDQVRATIAVINASGSEPVPAETRDALLAAFRERKP
jgi:predicted anti-sigma-YlaC factor YlaD